VISVPVPCAIQTAFKTANPAHPTGTHALTDILVDTSPYDGPYKKFRGLFAYTSGSTGRPKGIKRAFDPDGPDMWDRFKDLSTAMMGMTQGDRMHVSAPLYHSAPNALSGMALAAETVDLYIEPKFNSESFLKALNDDKITHAYVVPTMMVRLLKLDDSVRTKYDVSSLRFTISTGSPFPMKVKRDMIDWFGPIFNESYGASEIGFITLITSAEALAKPGSVGKIMAGGEVKVLDEDMQEVPRGGVGSLYIKLSQFGGFQYTNAEGSLKGQRTDDGFTSVGDMGSIDEDGYIYISDRKKDMIISGGANIFPAEIEAQLILMPEIADCAVFGAPDEEFGEQIVAAITCQPGAHVTLDTIHAFLEPRLARFKIPRKLDIHEALPRQESGKIYKAKLRAPYWEDAGRKV
jgi:long-chain acyl-CoA synthetase